MPERVPIDELPASGAGFHGGPSRWIPWSELDEMSPGEAIEITYPESEEFELMEQRVRGNHRLRRLYPHLKVVTRKPKIFITYPETDEKGPYSP